MKKPQKPPKPDLRKVFAEVEKAASSKLPLQQEVDAMNAAMLKILKPKSN